MPDYLEFWKLSRPVFTGTLETTDLYLPSFWTDAFDRLEGFCLSDQSLLLVTGATGCGKTAAAKAFYERLSLPSYDVLMLSLLKSYRNSGWVLPRIAEFFGIERMAEDGERVSQIATELDELRREGRRFVIIIDNAHYIENAVAAEEILGLRNAQTLAAGRINFALFGEPSITKHLSGDCCVELRALNRDETKEYVFHRCHKAQIECPLTESAIDHIHSLTGGTIALINALCENAMMSAMQRQVTQIDAAMVLSAAEYLKKQLPNEEGWNRQIQFVDLPDDAASTQSIPLERLTKETRPPEAFQEATSQSDDISLKSLFKNNTAEPKS